MVDLRKELLAAMSRRRYTYTRLLEESGLGINVSSLNRKLNGDQPLSADEGAALAGVLRPGHVPAIERLRDLAGALGGRVSWGQERRRRAS